MPGKGSHTVGGQVLRSLSLFSLPSQWLWGLNSQYLSSFMCFPGDKESAQEVSFPSINSQSLSRKGSGDHGGELSHMKGRTEAGPRERGGGSQHYI